MWRMKVQIEGRERPKDIFVDRWSTSDPAAIDVTVTHPLAPSTCFNIRSAKAVAAAKEKQGCEALPPHQGQTAQFQPLQILVLLDAKHASY